jgi:hypothetical protein
LLAGDELCTDVKLLEGFSQVLAIDMEVILDAAKRGGCTNYDGSHPPPGF